MSMTDTGTPYARIPNFVARQQNCVCQQYEKLITLNKWSYLFARQNDKLVGQEMKSVELGNNVLKSV